MTALTLSASRRATGFASWPAARVAATGRGVTPSRPGLFPIRGRAYPPMADLPGLTRRCLTRGAPVGSSPRDRGQSGARGKRTPENRHMAARAGGETARNRFEDSELMDVIIGIDPGLTGAIAVLNGGTVEMHDMPPLSTAIAPVRPGSMPMIT